MPVKRQRQGYHDKLSELEVAGSASCAAANHGRYFRAFLTSAAVTDGAALPQELRM
jgi:hypothetical protein